MHEVTSAVVSVRKQRLRRPQRSAIQVRCESHRVIVALAVTGRFLRSVLEGTQMVGSLVSLALSASFAALAATLMVSFVFAAAMPFSTFLSHSALSWWAPSSGRYWTRPFPCTDTRPRRWLSSGSSHSGHCPHSYGLRRDSKTHLRSVHPWSGHPPPEQALKRFRCLLRHCRQRHRDVLGSLGSTAAFGVQTEVFVLFAVAAILGVVVLGRQAVGGTVGEGCSPPAPR